MSTGPSSHRTSDLFPELVGRETLPDWAQGDPPAPIEDPVEVGWWSHPRKLLLVRPDGTEEVMDFYTIGDLATALGVKAVTIRKWEARGKLPMSPWRTRLPKNEQVPGKRPAGLRLYSYNQIVAAVKAAKLYGVPHRDANWDAWTEAIVEAWKQV